jgi:hypothetical protein
LVDLFPDSFLSKTKLGTIRVSTLYLRRGAHGEVKRLWSRRKTWDTGQSALKQESLRF